MKALKAVLLVVSLTIPLSTASAATFTPVSLDTFPLVGSSDTLEGYRDSLVLTDTQDTYNLNSEVEVLVGGIKDLSFEDLAAGDYEGEFVFIEDAELPDEQSIWLRLQIENQANPHTSWLLIYENYRINEVSAYLPDGNGGYREVRTGNTFPFSSRDFAYHYYVFELNSEPGSIGTIYLYLEDVSGLIPLYPLKIESLEHFSETAFVQYFWSGAYYFFIITILIYNILFVFSLRDRRVVSYALFLVSVILSSISNDGYGHQFVWPNNVFIAENSIRLFFMLYLVALLNFTLVMLDIGSHFPRWAAFSKGFVLVALLIIGLLWVPSLNGALLNYSAYVVLIVGFVMPLLVAIRLLPKNRRLALMFILAFSVYLGLMIATAFNTILGVELVNGIQINRIAFAWVLIVFTFAFNDQIVNIRREREKIQRELLVEKEDALRVQEALTKLMEQSRDNILDAYDTTLEGWAHLLEMRDEGTESHSRRVIELAVQLARKMGLEESDMIHIRRGALLHDIGKVAVPDSILQKPGLLTEEEWAVMKRHPLYAREAISRIPYLEKAMDIPVYHHENWDGSGYPYGMAGEEIPLAARIFTIVDNWEALLSDRPYREAWPYQKVMDYLRQNSGIKFDPSILPAFFQLVDDLGYYV